MIPSRHRSRAAASSALPAAARTVRDLMLAVARRADDVLEPRLHPRRRRRLVFDCSSPYEFAMFRPIYQRLEGEQRVDVFFTDSRHSDRPLGLYQPFGISERRILPAARAIWLKFDVHVSAQYFLSRFLRSTRRVQIFHGVGGKAWNISVKARNYDRLFLVSEYDRARFVGAGIFPSESSALEVVGMPKVDRLVDGSIDRSEILRTLGLAVDRPSVLYAPTWQTTSSLYSMGRQLIETLAAGPWNLLVKLHDNCYRRERSAGRDWERELAPLRSRENVRVSRDPDIGPLLVAADVLISDLSSAALEYLLLDRPVIVADAPELFDRFARDEVSHWQRQIGPLLQDPAAAPELVRRVLEQPGEHQAVRRRVAATVFHDPGRATERAVASLYRLLGLSPE